MSESPPAIPETAPSPPAAAASAGLRYVTDAAPGIRRVRAGRGFRYLGPDGRPLCDPADLARIRSLAIPPAYRNVWICPHPDGHLQATGIDVRGRKQYRYHPRWREVREQTKYDRMTAFGRMLPRIRRRTARDLKRPGLPREKVLATVVRLLETTLIRVGNEEYVRQNRSFGLTTLRERHVRVEDGDRVRFRFRGKGGKVHEIALTDRRLARVVRSCRDLPGQELFQYVDDGGEVRKVDSADVNAYLQEITGRDFTAKDFRTWAGTVLAACALQEFESFDSRAEARRNIVSAVERVAKRLGNTPTICRKCYIHPTVLDAYLEGALLSALRGRVTRELTDRRPGRLRAEEAMVLAFLESRLRQEARRDARKAKRPAGGKSPPAGRRRIAARASVERRSQNAE